MKVTTQMPSSNLLEAQSLAGHDGGDVDLLPHHADSAAGCDEGVAVVQGIVDLGQALVAAR